MRSSRLPWSRWVVMIASTTSPRSAGGTQPTGRASSGYVSSGRAWVIPMPAAGEHDEPGQLTGRALGQRRHDADVVGVHVDAVVAGPGDADLELARQVGVAVDRLDVVDRGDGVGAGVRARPFGMRQPGSAVTAFSPSTHSSQYVSVRGRKRATISATTGSRTAWRAGSGSGHAITLRTTSPHAASVVSSEALMPATSSRSSVLWTTWNCTPWRVVRRSLLVGELGDAGRGPATARG